MVEAKLLRKKLKNGLIVDKWDLVTIIEKQQALIKQLEETQVYLYKTHDADKAEIEMLKRCLANALMQIDRKEPNEQ